MWAAPPVLCSGSHVELQGLVSYAGCCSRSVGSSREVAVGQAPLLLDGLVC